MGVPAFYLWLSEKYPKIVIPALEDELEIVDGVQVPTQYAAQNPNRELDNLYLDMNGIVHPCTHPVGRPAPDTEDEMMIEVFRYTDRILRIARPRNVLMIAVDGVAPRAKMNQQRSRRFRAAQDAKVAAQNQKKKIEKARRRGEEIDQMIHKPSWDANVITPGTPFMDFLATSLRYWVAYKLNTDPGWKDLKVIISDATVPGEGEHKIMNFVRAQRVDPQYDPNTTHCIYGLDADLIFLGLATHEPHFRILREDVFSQSKITVKYRPENDESTPKPYIWLDLGILRQYLEVELDIPTQGFPFDLERAIDDWIFMAFFCGNDFLPHLPSLEIRENGIDILLWSWRRELAIMKGYVTSDGEVDLSRATLLLRSVASQEDYIFKSRREEEKRRKQERLRKQEERREQEERSKPDARNKKKEKDGNRFNSDGGQTNQGTTTTTSGEGLRDQHTGDTDLVRKYAQKARENKDLDKKRKRDLKRELKQEQEQERKKALEQEQEPENYHPVNFAVGTFDKHMGVTPRRAPAPAPVSKEPRESVCEDDLRLGEDGYHDRYYQINFGVEPEKKTEFVNEMVQKYIEGICWVLKYYYQGCPSWTWYYPYHYAPFAQDMTDIAGIKVEFDKGSPFLPYEQLMSVLPAASSHALPEVFRPLMSDQDSPIIDFYPEELAIDKRGTNKSWQGVVLLPFIDQDRLLENVRAKYPQLTQAELDRNVCKEHVLLVSGGNLLTQHFLELYQEGGGPTNFTFKAWQSKGLSGSVSREEGVAPHQSLLCPIEALRYPDISINQSLMVQYEIDESSMHKSMLLQGVELIENVLTKEQKEIIVNHRNKSDRHDRRDGRRDGRRKDAWSQATDGNAEPRAKREGGYYAFLEERARVQEYQDNAGWTTVVRNRGNQGGSHKQHSRGRGKGRGRRGQGHRWKD